MREGCCLPPPELGPLEGLACWPSGLDSGRLELREPPLSRCAENRRVGRQESLAGAAAATRGRAEAPGDLPHRAPAPAVSTADSGTGAASAPLGPGPAAGSGSERGERGRAQSWRPDGRRGRGRSWRTRRGREGSSRERIFPSAGVCLFGGVGFGFFFLFCFSGWGRLLLLVAAFPPAGRWWIDEERGSEPASLLRECLSLPLPASPLSLLLCECVFGSPAVCACTLCIYIWAGRLLQASFSCAALCRKKGSAAVVESTAALAAPTAFSAFLPSLHLHRLFPHAPHVFLGTLF